MESRKALMAPIVRLLLIVLLLGMAWPFIGEQYNQLLVRGVQLLSPRAVAVGSQARFITFVYREGRETALGINGLTLHSGLILMLALLAATPGLGVRSRLWWLLILMASFALLHTIVLGAFAWVIRWTGEGGGFLRLERFLPIYAMLWGLAPGIVGAAWCLRYWLPILRKPPGGPTPSLPPGPVKA